MNDVLYLGGFGNKFGRQFRQQNRIYSVKGVCVSITTCSKSNGLWIVKRRINMNYVMEKVTPIYTGGGVYVFLGKLTNGLFFIADSPYFDVRLLNEDPNIEITKDAYDIPIYNWDSVEWQEEHLVKDLNDDTDKNIFWNTMLDWCIKHNPEGNYSVEELKSIKQKLNIA